MKKYYASIILTSSAKHFANELKRKARGFNVIVPEKNKDNLRYFPDGEIYVKIPDVKKMEGKRTIVLHTGSPNPNKGLVELELILQILKTAKTKTEVFFTYFPYGMQDNVFEKGETNSAKNLIEKFIDYYKIKKIFVLDPHFGKRAWLLKYPIISVSALPLLIKKAQSDFKNDIIFVSADKGGKRRTGIKGANKKRINSFDVEFLACEDIDFKNKNIAVVDDIIETGGTLLKFLKLAKESGAKNVVALITHGVLPEGVKKIKKEFQKLYLTNSISQNQANIDITDLIITRLNRPSV